MVPGLYLWQTMAYFKDSYVHIMLRAHLFRNWVKDVHSRMSVPRQITYSHRNSYDLKGLCDLDNYQSAKMSLHSFYGLLVTGFIYIIRIWVFNNI